MAIDDLLSVYMPNAQNKKTKTKTEKQQGIQGIAASHPLKAYYTLYIQCHVFE